MTNGPTPAPRCLRQLSIHRRIILSLLLLTLGGCTSLPKNDDRQESYAFRDTDGTQLGKALHDGVMAHPRQSGFFLLPGGLDAFTARVKLAHKAERSIDVQTYLLHSDLVGRLFLDVLFKAADRGVRVRLLVDDMTLNDEADIDAVELDAHPNIEVRVFNPFGRKTFRWLQLATRFGKVTRRMHNKSFTVDNQATIIGGRNIGNEYFDADPDLMFGDLDLLAIGPVVNKVSTSFDLFWNYPESYPISTLVNEKTTPEAVADERRILSEYVAQHRDSAYLQSVRASPLATLINNWKLEFDWGDGEVLYDHPAKIRASRDQTLLNLSTRFKPYLIEAKRELTIFSPYFVPGVEGVEFFRELRARGVRVRIVTNSLGSTDVAIVHAGYSKYRKPLLRAGVEIYEIDKQLTREQRREKKGSGGSSKASLHAKSFVIDRERVFIGSLNLDPRSFRENTEIGMIVESPDIAARMSDFFGRHITRLSFRLGLEKTDSGTDRLRWYRDLDGETKIYTTEPHIGFWRRFGVGLMRPLPIESQL